METNLIVHWVILIAWTVWLGEKGWLETGDIMEYFQKFLENTYMKRIMLECQCYCTKTSISFLWYVHTNFQTCPYVFEELDVRDTGRGERHREVPVDSKDCPTVGAEYARFHLGGFIQSPRPFLSSSLLLHTP